MFSEVDRLLALIESDIPLDVQREIIKLWKLRPALTWTTNMPLCIPSPDGALPKGWMDWMLQVTPLLLEQVTMGLPFARVKSITLPTAWTQGTYRFEAPQIGFSLEVDEDPTKIQGLTEIAQQLGWTLAMDGGGVMRYTFGPCKVVGVDIHMSASAWAVQRRAKLDAERAARPPAAAPDTTPADSSDVPF